ncbi:MAG: hypothetical protein ACKO0Z_12280 [Betaproteobacteria bacterium]
MKVTLEAIEGLKNEDQFTSHDDWCDQIGGKAVEITDLEAEGLRATYWDNDSQEDVTIVLHEKRSGWGWWGGRYETDQVYHNGWSTPAGAIVAAHIQFEHFALA